MRWYVSRYGEAVGPVEGAEVIEWLGARGAQDGVFLRDEAASEWVPIEKSPFAYLLPGHSPVEASAPPAGSVPIAASGTQNELRVVGGGVAATILVAALLLWWWSTPKSSGETTVSTYVAPAQPAAPATAEERTPTFAENLARIMVLSEALPFVRGSFAESGTHTDPAAALFAIWSSEHLTWEELSKVSETKRALVMKDPAAEQGRRLCWSGSIIEIATDRSSGNPIFEGGIMNDNADLVRFLAVGSSGSLTERSWARVCGIVTGKISYSNSGGGTTHAVQIVGMFDLPQNKAAARQ